MHNTFTDSTITIRPLVTEDIDRVYSAVLDSIEPLSRWMAWCHPGYSRGESEAWVMLCERNWAAETDTEFGIFDAASGECLGGVGINQVNRAHSFANLGYWVRANRVQRGIATAAARLAARFAFQERGLTRVEIVTMVDNVASRQVAGKVGARFECIARNRLVLRGQAHDAALYSLIPGDLNI